MFITKKRLLAPIRIGILFSIGTYVMYRFGFFEFPGKDSTTLLLVVLIYNISMYFGFRFGNKLKLNQSKKYDAEESFVRIRKILIVFFWITVITCIPRFIIQTGMYDGGLETVIDRIVTSFDNAMETYHLNSQKLSATGFWRIINFFCVLTSFVCWAYTYLAIIFWKNLSNVKKGMTIIYWVIILAMNASKGTNFGYFEFAIAVGTSLAVKSFVFENKRRVNKLSRSFKRGKIGVVVVSILILGLFVFIFGNTMSTRVGEYYWRLIEYGYQYIPVDYQSIFYKYCPLFLRTTMITLFAYLTQGYFGLYLSFDVPFTSTFGFGDSWFKLFNFEDVTGINLLDRTLLYKIYTLHGYHYSNNWHTAYVWFGNDVSLFLVPFVLIILFAIWGSAWKDFLESGNLFALLTFFTFPTFIAFISANNQVFSSEQTFFAFWIFLIVWLKTRNKYKWDAIYEKAGFTI